MFRDTKKLILELLTTVTEGLEFCAKATNENQLTPLNDCTFAINYISDTLKTYSDDCPKSITKMDSFSETFKLLTLSFNENGITKDEYKNLIKLIRQLKTTIKSEIKPKLKIIFMPYKASMWNCLESIYNAAKLDDNCVPYLVPIPYYKKNNQGGLEEFCYEIDLFDKELEPIHYANFNLEEQNADIIYIHNPYDGQNTVTMVDPKFFSSNLKKYTDLLVYVPYFISAIHLKEEQEHIVVSAVNHADYVITQSDKHRKMYTDRNVSKSKLLVLGQPKLDFLENIKEKAVIPTEWHEKLDHKKVFLWNTNIFSFIRNDISHTENRLKEIYQDQACAVIMRPHPLTLATIKIYKPEIVTEYLDFIDRLSKLNNVIIDDYANILPAYMVSDALISEYSSLILEYFFLEKPVLQLDSSEHQKNCFNPVFDLTTCYPDETVSVTDFKEMVQNGLDPMFLKRLSEFKKSLPFNDGKAGERIHLEISKKLY